MILRAIERKDLNQLKDWRNEIFQTGKVRQWFSLNSEDQEEWFKKINRREEHIMLALEEEGFLAGCVGLTYVDWIRRRAEVSIYLGREEDRGKGKGKEALILICNYGFKTVNLYRLYAEIFDSNEASKGLFKSVGFIQEGHLRSHHYHNGRWIDSIVFGVLAREWQY